MSAISCIDWEMALEQVCGDKAFLKEILDDLLKESSEASDRILEGMRTRQFIVVMKAAHQVKGSASYLYCTDLQKCASKLQELGNEGTSCAEDERHRVWTQIEHEYQNLVAYVQILHQAVNQQFSSGF